MALLNFVLSKHMTGIGDDIELDVQQMSDGSSYEIDDPKAFISECIFSCIEGYIDFKYNLHSIRSLLDKDGIYRLELLPDDEAAVSCIILKIDNNHKAYAYDMQGSIRARQVFNIIQIDSSDVVYLVSEHIINPSPSCSLIERCYHSYFDDLHTAIRYMNHCMKDYELSQGSSNSGYRISVVSRKKIDVSKWYRKNLQAIENIKQYELDAEDYRYIVNIDDVLDSIAADAYDALDADSQNEIDRNIYQRIRPFLDEVSQEQFDVDIDVAMPDDVCDIVDSALLLVLVEADTQEKFDNIHTVLGPYEYRIGSLTDIIYNNHPDKGYILVSSSGEIQWYPDCYFLNEWDGAKNNPYFGKFMPNENDTLFCFREFHPEMIVDELPDDVFMMKYRLAYNNELAKQRERHDEMTFTIHDEMEFVIGDWYINGLQEEECQHNAVFPRKYEKYTFTVQECKDLLSGEEIKVDNYITKMGKKATIRGKLGDVTGPYDDAPRYAFYRTDIDYEKRKKINMEFGIQEPGMFPDDGI